MKSILFITMLLLSACGKSNEAPKVQENQIEITQEKPIIVWNQTKKISDYVTAFTVNVWANQPKGQNYFDGKTCNVFLNNEFLFQRIVDWKDIDILNVSLGDVIKINFETGETFTYVVN